MWTDGSSTINFEQQLYDSFQFYDIDYIEPFQIKHVSGYEICYKFSDNFYQYIWTDNIYVYKLFCQDSLSDDILIKMINGVEIKK